MSVGAFLPFPKQVRESEGKREKVGRVGKYPYLFLSFLLFRKQLLTDSYFLKETAHDLGLQGLWVYPSVRDGGGQLGKIYPRESDACPRPLRRSGSLAECPPPALYLQQPEEAPRGGGGGGIRPPWESLSSSLACDLVSPGRKPRPDKGCTPWPG